MGEHTPEMKRIINAYKNSVDKDIYNFIQDVLHGREVLPITIGYLSDYSKEKIINTLPVKNDIASRCVLNADSIRHIIKRHGANGTSDHSMADIEDIARMAYVYANFDEVIFDNIYSKHYKNSDGTPSPHIMLKKRINGTYYIIEAVNDSKTNRSYIVSAFIEKT